jgi:ferredoxin
VSRPAGAGDTLDVVIERDKCCSYGNCVVVAPNVFTLDDHDGIVQPLDPHPSAAHRAEVEQAVEGCPTEAIVLRN